MTTNTPLVMIAGQTRQLPSSNSLGGIAGGTATGEVMTQDQFGLNSVQMLPAGSPAFLSVTTTDGAEFDGVYVGRRTTEFSTNVFVGANNSIVTSGSNNTGVGSLAVHDVTSGAGNTGVGANSLHQIATGRYNCALGYDSLPSTVGGSYCIGIGYQALHDNISGNSSIGIGYNAGKASTGDSVIAIGGVSLENLASGNGTVAIGQAAGQTQADAATSLAASTNSIYIGANAHGYSNADDNTIVIGAAAKGEGANTTAIGNVNTASCHLFGALKIGDGTDETKTATFDCSGITTGTNRTVTLPDASGTMTLLGNASSGSGAVALVGSPTFTGTLNGAAGTFSGGLRAAYVGIGVAPVASRALWVLSTTTTDTTQIGITTQLTTDSSATVSSRGNYSQVTTAAGSYNTTSIMSYWAQRATIGAGATATNVIGYDCDIQTGGSALNACFRGVNATAANTFNLYMSGTAPNYLANNVLIGTTTTPTNATRNIAYGGGASTPVLGDVTADIVSTAAIDVAAGDRQLYARTEGNQANRLTGLSCYVSTAFSKTSDTTLANVTGLTRNVRAGEIYAFRAVLFTESNVAGGVKFAIGGTATATSIIAGAKAFDGAGMTVAVTTQRATALGGAFGDATAVTVAEVQIDGQIVVNAAGTLTVQFAQNASNGAASTVKAGSYFELISIGG